MRKFQPPLPGQGYHSHIGRSIRPTLRTDKKAANYARQSDHYAKKKDSQSKEMQTADLMEWAASQGWLWKDLDPYFADLALSGTLRPDQRPDLLRLFENMDKGIYDHGSVICFQESRLFRDETQIYYNQFIQKCKEHDIVVVVVSPFLMIYDFQDDFLTEMFRWKCKEAADFIKRHVKGWLHPARERAARELGHWAGLGDIPIGYIVDFDPKSPTFKKFIPYEPHAHIIRQIFYWFMELGGDISLLYRKLSQSPVIFPFFEPDVDRRNISKLSKFSTCASGYVIKNKTVLRSILTNPCYAGYRSVIGVIRRDSTGEKIISHEPIVERELFDFAFYRLSTYDLDGNPIESRRVKRYFHRGNKGEYGLLKFRIISNQGEVRTRARGDYDEQNPLDNGIYIIEPEPQEHEFSLAPSAYVEIPCETLDVLIVSRLMTHVHELIQRQENIVLYDEAAGRIRAERQQKLIQIEKSINDIGKSQSALTRRLGQVEAEIEEAEAEKDEQKKELKVRRKELIEEQIDTLEIERRQLLRAKQQLEKEAESDLGQLEDELMKLEQLWPKHTFEKRRSLINFTVREVVIDVMSTHWMHVQVLWLHEAWGREEMYYYRKTGKMASWTKEENEIVRDNYATMPKAHLMALLSHRGWSAICRQGCELNIARKRGRPIKEERAYGADGVSSHTDLEFMRSKGIPLNVKSTNWQRLYPRL